MYFYVCTSMEMVAMTRCNAVQQRSHVRLRLLITNVYSFISPSQLGLNDTINREALASKAQTTLSWNPPLAAIVASAVRDCPEPDDLKVGLLSCRRTHHCYEGVALWPPVILNCRFLYTLFAKWVKGRGSQFFFKVLSAQQRNLVN